MKHLFFTLSLSLLVLATACQKSDAPKKDPQPDPVTPVQPSPLPEPSEELPVIENSETIRIAESDKPFVHIGNRFGLRLMQALAAELPPHENVLLSPISLEYALAMLAQGCDPAAYEEIARAMEMADLTPAEMGAFYQRLTKHLETTTSKQRLFAANSAWLSEQYASKIRNEYIAALKQYFGAEVAKVNFSQSEEAIKLLNDWVAYKTYGRIRDLLSSGSVNESTRLVLINALFLASPWKTAFEEEVPGLFTNSQGETKEVVMLSSERNLNHIKTAEADVVFLPLEEGGFDFVAILPRDAKAPLSPKFLLDNEEAFRKEKSTYETLKLYLPVFDHSSSAMSLDKALQACGIGRVFDPYAKALTYISPEMELFVSSVLQKVMVKWDKKGLEAAAATAIIISENAAPDPDPSEVRFDRPFYFLVTHSDTGKVLFSGMVRNV